MSLIGGQIITAAMRSDLVVGRYALQDLLSSLFKSELAGVEVELPFDDTVDALGKRIFIGSPFSVMLMAIPQDVSTSTYCLQQYWDPLSEWWIR